ncbi:MAG: hypothetical protein WBG70_16280 [Spirulinaceae cyanobacterium]
MRFSPSEHSELVNTAMSLHCSVSTLVRHRCLDSRKSITTPEAFGVDDALREIALDLGKLCLEFQQSGNTTAVARLNKLINKLGSSYC